MVVSVNPPERQELLVPDDCPQCPGGGYDLISGARREFLLKRLNEALAVFQENQGVDQLLQALQDAFLKGLSIADLDRAVTGDNFGSLFIGCREISAGGGEPRIEITVVDSDQRYSVEVRKSQVIPLQTFTISGCPLVGKEEPAACIPETCPVVLQAKLMTNKRS